MLTAPILSSLSATPHLRCGYQYALPAISKAAQPLEYSIHIRANIDTSTDFSELAGALVDVDVLEASSFQAKSRGDAGNASASYRNAQGGADLLRSHSRRDEVRQRAEPEL